MEQEQPHECPDRGQHWEKFVASVVEEGRYGSASEVVHEGLRLVEEREAKLKALRDTIDAAIAEGGDHGDAGVTEALDAKMAEFDRDGS